MSRDDVERFRALGAEDRAERRRKVRVLIPTGLGLNCEVETEVAFRLAGASPERVHLLDLLDGGAGRRLADYSVLTFVGGFAFGDHLGAGFVFANKIRWRLYDQLLGFIEAGGLALGICNGFQTMVRLGLLPGLDGDYRTPRATLAPNDRLGYRDAWVRLAFDANNLFVLEIVLGFVMFGVALDLRLADFKQLLRSPKAPGVGLLCQFVLLPALTWALSRLLRNAGAK